MHDHDDVCVTRGTHTRCHVPEPIPSAHYEDDRTQPPGQGTNARPIVFMVIVCVGLMGAMFLSSRHIATHPDGKTVLIVGPSRKGLTAPSLQGTNCGIGAIANASLIVNFAALTMRSDARPTTPCASLDADHDR